MNYMVPFRVNKPTSTHLLLTPDDYWRANILRPYRPRFNTLIGLREAVLHKLTRLNNGRIGALYDVKVVNPYTRRHESTRFLYEVDRHGTPRPLKKLSTLVS